MNAVVAARLRTISPGYPTCIFEFSEDAANVHQAGGAGCTQASQQATELVQVGDKAWVRYAAGPTWTQGKPWFLNGTGNKVKITSWGYNGLNARAAASNSMETCGPKPCYHVTYDGYMTPHTEEWWFDVTTYLPLKRDSIPKGGGSATFTMEYSDLNGPIDIHPPV